MKTVLYIFSGISLLYLFAHLYISYDLAHPTVSAKKQKYTIQFDMSEKIDKAIIMMALPIKTVKIENIAKIKHQCQKNSSMIEMKHIKGNTFTFQLPIRNEKYNLFPEQTYDEFSLSIIILLKSKTGACMVDITKNIYEYKIAKKNIQLKKRDEVKNENKSN